MGNDILAVAAIRVIHAYHTNNPIVGSPGFVMLISDLEKAVGRFQPENVEVVNLALKKR